MHGVLAPAIIGKSFVRRALFPPPGIKKSLSWKDYFSLSMKEATLGGKSGPLKPVEKAALNLVDCGDRILLGDTELDLRFTGGNEMNGDTGLVQYVEQP